MFNLLPRGVPEALLLLVILSAVVLVIRAIRRRRAFAPVEADADLPPLTTTQRLVGTLRRVYRDPAQGVWLADLGVGKRKFTLCLTDYAQNAARYESLLGKQADFAIFALSTLAEGGVEAMRDQIKDIDKVEITPDLVRLIPAGQYANDHAVIGRILSHREEEMDGLPLTVYRTQVVRGNDLTLVMELAAQKQGAPFADQTMVHGSARLFGYLAEGSRG
jgi:hypothetical protein